MGGRRKDGGLSHGVQRDIDRCLDEWDKRPEPVSLSQTVVEATGNVHEGDGTWVRAQVPMMVAYTTTEMVEGRVVAWTPRAVKVEFEMPGGRPGTAWVWASAVERK